MITKVVKIKDGVYEINELVILSEFHEDESGDLNYTISWDGEVMTEEEALEISEEFIQEAYVNATQPHISE